MRISDWSSDVCSSDLHDGGAEGDVHEVDQRVRLLGEVLHTVVVQPVAATTGVVGRVEPRRLDELIQLLLQEPDPLLELVAAKVARPAERRVGKGGVRTCSTRWPPYH